MTAAPASPVTVAGAVTQVRVARSEWTKLRALRSNWYCVLTAVVLVAGLGAVIAAAVKPHGVSAEHPAAAAVSLSLSGITLAQLAFGVLGVLLFSGEYGTGVIRVSLTAVPSRLPVLWAKLAVLAGLVLPVTLLSAMADFFVVTAIRSAKDAAPIALTDPGVLRTVVGSSLYLTVAAIAGLALGALLRNTAFGLSVFTAAFFVAPLVVVFLPQTVTSGIAPYLPSNAGGAVWGQTFVGHPLGPWAGFAVMCGYAIALIGLAAWRLRRSDA